MIVKNEATNIKEAIQNFFNVADEVIVVDTGSSDNTRDLCVEAGARVFDFKWKNNFSEARNESLKYAIYPWVTWLDADDRLPSKSIQEINFLKENSRIDCFYGFTLRNINQVNTDFVGGETIVQSRMFPNQSWLKFKNRLHESATRSAIEAGCEMKLRDDIVIDHIGYQDEKIVQAKLIRNISIMLIDMGFNENTKFSTFKIFNFNCFYAPNILSVWKNNKMIGICDPFLCGIADDLQVQNKQLYESAFGIINQYNLMKEKVDKINNENIVTLEEELLRMQNNFDLVNAKVIR
jgi:glycosyltransferase involved in cell wall biosynthesis